MSLSIIILAAGQGTRMFSDLPKVLHRLAGRTLLEHVYNSAGRLPHRQIRIVYGYGGRLVPDTLAHLRAEWVEQTQQLGTGHAVRLAIPSVPDDDMVLILYGDIPLISDTCLGQLVATAGPGGFGLLTAILDEPAGYGRIVRDAGGQVRGIVEEKDATPEQRQLREINTGMMAVRASLLKRWLAALDNRNAQGEFYLTDIVAMAVAENIKVNTLQPPSLTEILGVNSRAQLAMLERSHQQAQAQQLLQRGVTVMDPARFDLRGELTTGKDVCIDINVIFEGVVSLGNQVMVGPNCQISNSRIGDGVIIQPNCVIENAIIGNGCRVGPFARIRPGTRLDNGVHIGNFVEVKQSEIGNGSKVNHLSYIGDSSIGQNVNVGAGTITCNYDGANKHRTIIGDNVFIGSDTQLIAPVEVGNGATIGAGTTVTRDIAADTLTVNRLEHRIVHGWKRPQKKS